MVNNENLCEQLSIWETSDTVLPHVLHHDGSISTGVEIIPLDIECYDETLINQLTLRLRSFLNALPENIKGQFYLKIDNELSDTIEKHKNLSVTDNDFLKSIEAMRIQKIQDRAVKGELFQIKIYFFLKSEGYKQKNKWFNFKEKKDFSQEVKNNYEERLQLLLQSLSSIKSNLYSCGFGINDLDKDKMLNIFYSYLNPKRSKEVECPVIHKNAEGCEQQSEREQLVFGDVVLGKEDFTIDQTRVRVLSLKTLPEMSYSGMMSGFLSLPFKYEVFLNFKINDQSKEMASLQQKRRIAHSLSSTNGNKVSDLESESRLGQTTELIREIIETGQKIFEVEMIMILKGEDSISGIQKLNLQTKDVLSKFRSLSGSEGLQETVGAWKIFKNTMPACLRDLVRAKKMKTNNLADFLPLYGANSGDSIPMCLSSTRQGTLYALNPYSSRLNNYNNLVTGASGSGKSFANNFFVLQQIARGTKVFVIDIGASYKKMTEILKGQYFDVSLSSTFKLNPFYLAHAKEAPSGEKIKGLVNIIEQMVVDEGDKLQKFDRVLIEKGLESVFEDCRHLKEPRSPTLSDFQKYCLNSKEEVLVKIGKLLFPWVGNTPYGKLLDGQGNIASDKPIVAFDLKGLSQYPDLQSVVILILTQFILEQVELDKNVSKRILMDEVWALLKSPSATQFMEYAARTFRKTGSGITFITQSVEEIIGSGMGAAILNNTASKLIMLQKGDTQSLQDALKLNSREVNIIHSLEQVKGLYSEGFLMDGETRQITRIEPTPLEYWVATSDAKDNAYLENLKEKFGSLEASIEFAHKEYPYGISQGKAL